MFRRDGFRRDGFRGIRRFERNHLSLYLVPMIPIHIYPLIFAAYDDLRELNTSVSMANRQGPRQAEALALPKASADHVLSLPTFLKPIAVQPWW